jgi:hypothetical protein
MTISFGDHLMKTMQTFLILFMVGCVFCAQCGVIGQQQTDAPYSRADESDDICQIKRSDEEVNITCNQTRSYLDIAKITRFFPDSGNVTLMMIFHGVITDAVSDPSVRYIMWFNTSYGKTILDYSNGVNSGYTYLFNESSQQIPAVSDVTITENTIQVTYPVLATGYPDQNIEAHAIQTDGSVSWIGRGPSEKKGLFDGVDPIDYPGSSTEDDGEDTMIPGFSTILVLASILIGVCWYILGNMRR